MTTTLPTGTLNERLGPVGALRAYLRQSTDQKNQTESSLHSDRVKILLVIVECREHLDKRAPDSADIGRRHRGVLERCQRISDGEPAVWYVGTGRLRFDDFRLVRATRYRS
jgi:hypothetical protein